MTDSPPPTPSTDPRDLDAFVRSCERLVVLTGAGISTASGIPDYRDADGEWKRSPPMTWQAFSAGESGRRRYWARSLLGWPRIAASKPSAAHRALVRLETQGRARLLVTQNVDGLHQRAGSRRVVDLHGRLDRVVCLECRGIEPRAEFQARLLAANPGWPWVPVAAAAASVDTKAAPDGDADLDGVDFDAFVVPPCRQCHGTLKPDVVFFGESVPRDRVAEVYEALEDADGLLVVGSSLMVFSGWRFARDAAARGLPIAAVNLGRTRADPVLDLKIVAMADAALADLWPEDGKKEAQAMPAATTVAPFQSAA
jgi:NAD-dependent SIR2 family protein deacetylase